MTALHHDTDVSPSSHKGRLHLTANFPSSLLSSSRTHAQLAFFNQTTALALPISEIYSPHSIMATDPNPVPPQYEVVKEFPPQGTLRQYRFAEITTFTCHYCSQQKTAKLVATDDGEWDALICNGCYGYLLSNPKKTEI